MEIYVIREDGYHYGDISHSYIVGAHKIEKDAIKHLSDGCKTGTEFHIAGRAMGYGNVGIFCCAFHGYPWW